VPAGVAFSLSSSRPAADAAPAPVAYVPAPAPVAAVPTPVAAPAVPALPAAPVPAPADAVSAPVVAPVAPALALVPAAAVPAPVAASAPSPDFAALFQDPAFQAQLRAWLDSQGTALPVRPREPSDKADHRGEKAITLCPQFKNRQNLIFRHPFSLYSLGV
jgi:hypothetical protein